MNALTTDIKTIIEDNTDWVFGTDLFGGREPASPTECVTIFNQPGGGRFLFNSTTNPDGSKTTYEYTGFQLRARSKNYEKAILMLSNLIDILHGIGNQVVNGTKYTVIESLDSPFLLEWDDENRAKVVTNFAVQRTPNT
jgi:hypothetical protein